MQDAVKIKNDILNYIDNREKDINRYVMRCFSAAMIVYFIAFLLNVFDIFIIDKQLMKVGFITSIIV